MSASLSANRSKTVKRWTVLLSTRRGLKSPFTPAAYKQLIRKILAHPSFIALPESFSEVSILLCSDDEIQKLNREYRRKDKATDVLSFPQEQHWDKGLSSPSLGDLVISLETAKRQARRFRWTLRQEVIRLTTHGLLHLAGYDHEKVSAKEAQRMRRAERQVVLALGKKS